MKNKLVKLKQEDLEKRCRERTLILCKPESILTGEYPEILRRIQRLHFKTPLLKMFKFSKKSVIEFYKEVVNNWEPKEDMIEIFTKMIEYPTLAGVVEGPNSIVTMRKLAGGIPKYKSNDGEIIFEKYSAQFQPVLAPMGTIRGDYSSSDIDIPDTTLIPIPNFMHASDSKESYNREIDILIKYNHISKGDFIDYKRPDWGILFGINT
ncbi:hypothetical protein J4446_03505 [Candidatus Woesearchaeota archaeon]|nr:hypothetical protein [Candidatus Woesearchaeota archaeon]